MARTSCFALVMFPMVRAVRESQAFLQHQSIVSKCTPRCTGQKSKLHGEVPEVLRFQDCKVNESKPFFDGWGTGHCVEYCTLADRAAAGEVKVVWTDGLPVPCKVSLKSTDQRFCRSSCCVSKCSGESSEVKGKVVQFKDCQLKGPDAGRCVETCTTQEDSQVEVLRKSGVTEPGCELLDPDLSLSEMALGFMEQLEKTALTLTASNYGDLPLMASGRILPFLQKVQSEVLVPEFQQTKGEGFTREIDNSTVKHLAIIGDLHGQLWNLLAYLLRIQEEYKDKSFKTLDGSSLLFCDPQFQYVFLGDYVDRGERGLELLLLLLAYKAQCPNGLILLQGNHESPRMWDKYGFSKELSYKLKEHVKTSDVRAVTMYLPYMAVVLGQFMMLHGGITPQMVERCEGKEGHFAECLDEATASQSVWPDPHGGKDWKSSNRGRGIYKFGMNVAKKFLKSNGLKGIFRGHEQVAKGYEVKSKGWFQDRYFVATVFSAADYVGLFCPEGRKPEFDSQMFKYSGGGNRGAFVLADLTTGKVNPVTMKASETRKDAARLTGAKCGSGLFQKRSRPNSQLDAFLASNHQRFGVDNSSCSLGETETQSLKEEVKQVLTSMSPEDREFEARKFIDLEGEALVDGDGEEICKSILKDQVTLDVYNQLQGTDEEFLENDIKVRADELEH